MLITIASEVMTPCSKISAEDDTLTTHELASHSLPMLGETETSPFGPVHVKGTIDPFGGKTAINVLRGMRRSQL